MLICDLYKKVFLLKIKMATWNWMNIKPTIDELSWKTDKLSGWGKSIVYLRMDGWGDLGERT